MEKKVYLINNEFTSSATSTIGFTINKPYKVIEESKKKFSVYGTKSIRLESRYKVSDDYGNIRWISAEWFCEMDDIRDDKINKLLD
jgi:hypothetical protein